MRMPRGRMGSRFESISESHKKRADRKEARLDRDAPFTALEVARDDGICRAAGHSGRAVYACAA